MTKIKIDAKNKIFLIIIFSLIFAFLFFKYNLSGITGFNALNVSIKEKTVGQILLGYNSSINLSESQPILAEFVNTGTSNYSARIELTIYMYNNTSGSLQQLANYYDNYVFLQHGERESFKTVFLPTETGTYYIKARVPYDARTAELWGSFSLLSIIFKYLKLFT